MFSLRNYVYQIKYEKLNEQQCVFMALRNFRRDSGIIFKKNTYQRILMRLEIQ